MFSSESWKHDINKCEMFANLAGTDSKPRIYSHAAVAAQLLHS